jgi:hypothetical protein
MSSNGKYQYIGTDTGIWISATYGSTWSTVTDYQTPYIVCSYSGQYVLRTITLYVSGQTALVSNDYGASWTYVGPTSIINNAYAPCMSSSGRIQYFAKGYAYYNSIDFGVTWNTMPNAPAVATNCMVCSSDGTYILMCSADYIYVSNNSGTTFTSTGITYDTHITCGMSATGQYMYVVMCDNVIYKRSTNYGVTWSSPSSMIFTSPAMMQPLAVSSNGSIVIVPLCSQWGLGVSINFGGIWNEYALPSNYYVNGVHISPDGSIILLSTISHGGYIAYATKIFTGTVVLNGTTTTLNATTVALTGTTVYGTNMILNGTSTTLNATTVALTGTTVYGTNMILNGTTATINATTATINATTTILNGTTIINGNGIFNGTLTFNSAFFILNGSTIINGAYTFINGTNTYINGTTVTINASTSLNQPLLMQLNSDQLKLGTGTCITTINVIQAANRTVSIPVIAANDTFVMANALQNVYINYISGQPGNGYNGSSNVSGYILCPFMRFARPKDNSMSAINACYVNGGIPDGYCLWAIDTNQNLGFYSNVNGVYRHTWWALSTN